MSTTTPLLLLKEKWEAFCFYILQSYVRWTKWPCVCFQNLKYGLALTIMVSWLTLARGCVTWIMSLHICQKDANLFGRKKKANSIALQGWHCMRFIVYFQPGTYSNSELNSLSFKKSFRRIVFCSGNTRLHILVSWNFHKARGEKLHSYVFYLQQNLKLWSSEHTWNAVLQCPGNKLSPDKSIGGVPFFLFSSYTS